MANLPLRALQVDVVYAVVHLYDGRVAAFSGQEDLQRKRLDDPVSLRTLEATTPLAQHVIIPQDKEPGYDAAIPTGNRHEPWVCADAAGVRADRYERNGRRAPIDNYEGNWRAPIQIQRSPGSCCTSDCENEKG